MRDERSDDNLDMLFESNQYGNDLWEEILFFLFNLTLKYDCLNEALFID